METSRFFRTILFVGLFMIFLLPSNLMSQNLPMDRFCDIYSDSAPLRLDKIIRLFKLQFRPLEQLNGQTECSSGETFTLKTSCVGAFRVVVFSLSHPESETLPSHATRLIHLYSNQSGRKMPVLCHPPDGS